MKFERIQIAERTNLFDVEKGVHSLNEKARTATAKEVKAYCRFLREQRGLPEFEAVQTVVEQDVLRGVTFGSNRRSYIGHRSVDDYEAGSYSIPVPGGGRQTVTFEQLDEAGSIISSQTFPVDPKKRGVLWDKKAVCAAVGPIDKPKAARKTRAAAAQVLLEAEVEQLRTALAVAIAERDAAAAERDSIFDELVEISDEADVLRAELAALKPRTAAPFTPALAA